MAKYKIIRDKYERYSAGKIISSTFTAKDDVEAILKVDDHCGYGYYDEEDRGYEDEGFIRPTLKEAVDNLAMNNGDGTDFVLRVENLDTKKIIFDEPESYIEKEENW